MRLFRGLSVPNSDVDQVLETIRRNGLSQGRTWAMTYRHPGPLGALLARDDLSLSLTRPIGAEGAPAICACGDELSAAHYSWKHNRTKEDDTPVIVEFEANDDQVAIDGRDFLYTAFQKGPQGSDLANLERAFGSQIVPYLKRAWDTDKQDLRIALCDVATYDPAIKAAHHASSVVIAGRHGTLFTSAFIVKLPVSAGAILRAWEPSEPPVFSVPELTLR